MAQSHIYRNKRGNRCPRCGAKIYTPNCLGCKTKTDIGLTPEGSVFDKEKSEKYRNRNKKGG